jgi:acyl-coenzyme A thioesterase PaaI-like protein
VWLLLGPLLPERTLTSIEFKLNFVRPALAERGELLAVAKLVRRGRTVALASVDVLQAGELIATGLFTYLVSRVEPG